MLVGAGTVHVKNGFFAQNGGYEYALLVAVAALTLAFTGPGSLSLDALLGYYLSGAIWGVAALLIGIIGAVVPLMQRRRTSTQQIATAK
jgi:putative oxidoreductase